MFSLHLDEFQRALYFFYCVENIEFYVFRPKFADSINFFLPSEEKCCRIASNACRSIRWQYSEPCAVLQVVCEKFQNGNFDVRTEEHGRPAKKFEDAELQALLDGDDGEMQEHLAEQLNVDQSTVSPSSQSNGQDNKGRSIGTTRANGPSTGKLWFEKFQNGNFDVRAEEHGRPAKKFEDAELQALLDGDDGEMQEHLAEQLIVDQSTVSPSSQSNGQDNKGRWIGTTRANGPSTGKL
ncbi:hypothetical protein TNCV_486921 [Trichonephila clavipes]|nr:hypothetical protein TNCV_486921 [Trichonephila clavipes]